MTRYVVLEPPSVPIDGVVAAEVGSSNGGPRPDLTPAPRSIERDAAADGPAVRSTHPEGAVATPGDGAVFVRDGFSLWAFLFTFLWLFRHRLWLAGLITLALVVGFVLLDGIEGFGLASTVLEILVGLLVALEGPSLRIARLRRLGWHEAAAFEAESRDEAEMIYYAGKDSAVLGAGVGGPSGSSPDMANETPMTAAAGSSRGAGSGVGLGSAMSMTMARGAPAGETPAAPRHYRFFDAMRAR